MQTERNKKKNYKFKEIEIKKIFSKISWEKITKYFEYCIKVIKLNAAINKYNRPQPAYIK